MCRLRKDGRGAGCQGMLLRGCPWPLVSETGTRASPAIPERRKRAASRGLHLARPRAGPAAKGTQERTAPQAPPGGFPSPTVSSVGWVVFPPLPAPPHGSKHTFLFMPRWMPLPLWIVRNIEEVMFVQ